MLWGLETHAARGPRPVRTVDEVAVAALALADDGGLDAVSMRRLASALGIGTMTVYSSVQNREDLVDLIVDRAYGEIYPDGRVPGETWRERALAIARANADLCARHAWLLDVDLARPVLGPGETRKYDLELGALDGIGLDDVALDATVTLLVSHAASAARRAREASRVRRESGRTDEEWWAANAPILARIAELSVYEVAARVGTAVGEAQNSAFDADAELRFGVARIVDGIAALLDAHGR